MFLIISEIYLFLFRTHVKLGNRHKLSVGTEYIVDVLKSQTDNIAKEDAYTLALFAQDEIKLLRNLQASLR